MQFTWDDFSWEAFYKDATEQAIAASQPGFSNKADAVRYYQAKYPGLGKGGWKQRLVHDLQPFTVDSKHPEGIKPKSLERRFDSGAKGSKRGLSNPEPGNAKQYQALARHLGLLNPPPNGYYVHYEGGLFISECEYRDFTVAVTDNFRYGEAASAVARDPSRIVEIAVKVYMQLPLEGYEWPQPCDDYEDREELGPPHIVIRARRDEDDIPSYKQHKPAIPFFKR